MTAPLGTCKLCLRADVVLQESHTVPRWVYKRILRDQGDIVQLKGRDIVASRDQLKEYLLCFECEQRCGTTFAPCRYRSSSVLTYPRPLPNNLLSPARPQATRDATASERVSAEALAKIGTFE